MLFVTWSVNRSPESFQSVFRASPEQIVEKTSVFRDLDRQRVSRESPESLQSVLRASPEQILEKTSVFRVSELEIVEKRSVFRALERQKVEK